MAGGVVEMFYISLIIVCISLIEMLYFSAWYIVFLGLTSCISLLDMLYFSDLLSYSSPSLKSVFLCDEKARWEQVAGGGGRKL